MAWAKFVILITLAISSKLCRGDIISTLSALVFEDLDLVNYNTDKLFKTIKDKYILIAIISVNSKKYIAVLK